MNYLWIWMFKSDTNIIKWIILILILSIKSDVDLCFTYPKILYYYNVYIILDTTTVLQGVQICQWNYSSLKIKHI